MARTVIPVRDPIPRIVRQPLHLDQAAHISFSLSPVITSALSDGDLKNCWNTAAEPNMTISFMPSVTTTEYINIRLDLVLYVSHLEASPSL